MRFILGGVAFFSLMIRPELAAAADFCGFRPSSVNRSAPSYTVAVIDTGLDTDHRFVRRHLWENPGETGVDSRGRDKATNGIDDDGNGYVDDVHGWNFGGNNSNLYDEMGHGTHITGLVLSGGQAWNGRAPAMDVPVRIMVLKYQDPRYMKSRGQAFQKALEYALRQKADLIHISGGGYQPLSSERRLLKKLEARHVPVIVASGNKAAGRPDLPFFPAAYPFKNLLRVSAINPHGELLETTNETPGRPLFREDGFELLSLLPGHKIGRMTGTSQAAARFTGKLLRTWFSTCDFL